MTAVTLLIAADCGLCEQAKEVLRHLAPEFVLDVEVLDLDSEQGQVLGERSGMVFPAAILLDGAPFGFGRVSERKLRRELARRTAGPAS